MKHRISFDPTIAGILDSILLLLSMASLFDADFRPVFLAAYCITTIALAVNIHLQEDE